MLLDQCADELEILVAEQVGDGPVVERIRERIEELFGQKESAPESIFLDQFMREKIEEIRPLFSHRQVDVITDTELTQPVCMPLDALEKVVKGLIRNGIENTPDKGKIEIAVKNNGQGVELVIHDTGIGIVPEHQKRIFEGFFPTQETTAYASRKPFVFNGRRKAKSVHLWWVGCLKAMSCSIIAYCGLLQPQLQLPSGFPSPLINPDQYGGASQSRHRREKRISSSAFSAPLASAASGRLKDRSRNSTRILNEESTSAGI
ncbi:MAG: hypothetical protein B6I32_07050 [Desulfobacterium sp. 4572_20]|nr:MAG: hypothetical protein B6I32_07050 [Desulfobacterium sp. 4572_20]